MQYNERFRTFWEDSKATKMKWKVEKGGWASQLPLRQESSVESSSESPSDQLMKEKSKSVKISCCSAVRLQGVRGRVSTGLRRVNSSSKLLTSCRALITGRKGGFSFLARRASQSIPCEGSDASIVSVSTPVPVPDSPVHWNTFAVFPAPGEPRQYHAGAGGLTESFCSKTFHPYSTYCTIIYCFRDMSGPQQDAQRKRKVWKVHLNNISAEKLFPTCSQDKV